MNLKTTKEIHITDVFPTFFIQPNAGLNQAISKWNFLVRFKRHDKEKDSK